MNIPEGRIEKIYEEYFRAIKLIMRREDYNRDIPEDQFMKEKHCFNMIGLGKLGVPYIQYKNIFKKKSRNDKDKESNSDV